MSGGFSWTIPPPAALATGGAEPTELTEEDLLFTHGDLQTTAAGDYVTVAGPDADRQSVMFQLSIGREEYKLRPQWGIGVPEYLKKPMTKGNLDELKQRCLHGLALNPRVARVDAVTVEAVVVTARPGLRVSVAWQSRTGARRSEPFVFVQSP